jgi:hypothetical protein
LEFTKDKKYRYVIPFYWLNNIIEISKDSTRRFTNSLISIQNECFLTPNKEKISSNINPYEIGLVYFEIMMEIVKNFNIDYIIQVTFEEKKKQISIKDGVAIFKKKEFLKTDIKNEKDIKINKVYLIYPKDFTFRENIVGNKSHKENSNVYLNHSDEDIGNKIETLKKNKIKSNKDFNNNEKIFDKINKNDSNNSNNNIKKEDKEKKIIYYNQNINLGIKRRVIRGNVPRPSNLANKLLEKGIKYIADFNGLNEEESRKKHY